MGEEEAFLPLPQHARLYEVSGCSSVSPQSLAVDEVSGQTAYITGSTITVVKQTQAHLISSSRNPFSCISFSSCGRYLVSGETGQEPCVRIWEVCDEEGRFVGRQVSKMIGHSFGVSAVAFLGGGRPNCVSIGDANDKMLIVWDWRTGRQVNACKLNNQVSGMAMSPDGVSFVTYGAKHAKMWTFEADKLHGRSFILNDKRNCHFSSGIFVSENRFLAVADNSFVVEVVGKKLQNTYRFGHRKIFDMAMLNEETLLVGCDSGMILALSLDISEGFHVQWSFPLPHYVGMDPADATHDSVLDADNHPQNSMYPDIRSLSVHQSSQSTSVLYSDRSLYVWRRSGGETVKMHSQLAHLGAVNVIEVYPDRYPFLPSGTYVTGGSDGTVRFWNSTKDRTESMIQTSLMPLRNVYSLSLKKILYTSDDVQLLTEPIDENGMVPSAHFGSTDAIKCLRFSPDGRHLIIGRQNGCILVMDVTTMALILNMDAHESDVFALEFNDPGRSGISLMASGSRDKLVHLYNVSQTYEYLQTLQDHQGAVIAIKFATANDGTLRMFTLGTDKLIILWNYTGNISSPFSRATVIKQGVSMTDMVVLPEMNGIAVGCIDRQIRLYSLSGKQLSGFSATGSDKTPSGNSSFGKLIFDPSGSLCASICDKMVQILDMKTQKALMSLPGTGETPTQIAFSNDLKNMLVCAANGCIYTWRLSQRLTQRLHTASRELMERIESRRVPTPDSVLGSGSDCVSEEHPVPNSESLDSFASSSIGPSTFGSIDSIHLLGQIDPSRTFRVPDREFGGLEVERRVESVVRHGNNSSLGQSGSNFDLTSEKDPEESIYEQRTPKQYTTSKSMQNLRLPMQQESPRKPRTPRRQWADESQADFNSHSLLAGLIEGSQKQQSPPNSSYLNNNNENVYAMPMPSTIVSPPTNGNYTAPLSMQQRLGQARLSSSPKTVSSPFNRNDQQRVSLSKTFLNKGLSIALQPKPAQTVWSPQGASQGGRDPQNSRRTMSTLTGGSGTPTGAVASAITRRQSTVGSRVSPSTSATSEKIRRSKTFGRMKDIQETPQDLSKKAEDYSSSNLHLRSRSQSPNHLLTQGLLTPKRRDSDMTMQGASQLSASSRVLTSSRTNLHQPEAIRKSNQALDKLANMRTKLRQSTENIMGDENSSSGGLQPSSSVLRSKSIGNLRNGNQLEPFGSFDVEGSKPKLGSSLTHSRLLARSMGNVSASEDAAPKTQTPSNQLAQTIQMLKKASNPDLTQPDQFDESTSFQERLIRRGAVQKRVERYHPRNRPNNLNGRGAVGTSEESDSASNDSNASPLNGSQTGQQGLGRRYFGVTGNRSASSVESRGMVASGRRLFDPKHGNHTSNGPSTPTRRGNYLASKLAGEGDVAPDLVSDESARAPSAGPSELIGPIPEKDQPMVRHVDAALKQALIAVDQALHAEKLLRESDVADRTRDALNEQCLKTLLQISGRVSSVLERNGVSSPGDRRSTDDSLRYDQGSFNGNGLPTSLPNGPIDMSSFLAQHGNQLMELLKNNLAKSN